MLTFPLETTDRKKRLVAYQHRAELVLDIPKVDSVLAGKIISLLPPAPEEAEIWALFALHHGQKARLTRKLLAASAKVLERAVELDDSTLGEMVYSAINPTHVFGGEDRSMWDKAWAKAKGQTETEPEPAARFKGVVKGIEVQVEKKDVPDLSGFEVVREEGAVTLLKADRPPKVERKAPRKPRKLKGLLAEYVGEHKGEQVKIYDFFDPEAIRTCPKCGSVGPAEKVFGSRKSAFRDGIAIRVQSQCKKDRRRKPKVVVPASDES